MTSARVRGRARALARLVGAVALTLAVALPAQAQDPNLAAAPATQGPAEDFKVPDEVLRAAASDTPEAQEIVRNFLRGETGLPQAVTARAVLMIEAMKAQRPYDDPLTLVETAGQVADLAREMLHPTQIMRLFVTPDFQPGSGTVALDFGTAAAPPQQGFERIAPNDPRIEGANLEGVTKPGESQLMSNGIRGVTRLKVPVPDGPKRIILLTEDLGEASALQTPFGSSLNVNGREFGLGDQPPDQWIPTAALAAPGADIVVGDSVVGGVSARRQRGGAWPSRSSSRVAPWT